MQRRCPRPIGAVPSIAEQSRFLRHVWTRRKWLLKEDGSKRLLWERSWEDRYTAPGEPMMRRGARGRYFVVQPTPTSLYLEGSGASPLGDRPFLDLLDFGAEEIMTTRLWRCTVVSNRLISIVRW